MDVSAIAVFHREGAIVPLTVRSLAASAAIARAAGIDVETLAVLDRADGLTAAFLGELDGAFDRVVVTDHGDPAAARNAGIDAASGTYVALLDGDDLWGSSWLARAYSEAEKCANGEGNDHVWHPQFVHYFTAQDYYGPEWRDNVLRPHSFYLEQVDSRVDSFDPRTILFNNLWIVNGLARRDLYQRVPFQPTDHNRGVGVEDWSWNAETLADGVHHGIVPETVHCIRLRPNSRSADDASAHRLPRTFEVAERIEELWRRKAK